MSAGFPASRALSPLPSPARVLRTSVPGPDAPLRMRVTWLPACFLVRFCACASVRPTRRPCARRCLCACARRRCLGRPDSRRAASPTAASLLPPCAVEGVSGCLLPSGSPLDWFRRSASPLANTVSPGICFFLLWGSDPRLVASRYIVHYWGAVRDWYLVLRLDP